MTETAAGSAGKELIDATQEAVIGAVSDVENIIQTTTAEIAGGSHEVFYMSAEFWVGMAFVVVVAALFFPLKKVLQGMLQKRIDGVVSELDEAAALRDEARRLLADYEQRTDDVKADSEALVRKARKEAAAFCGREVKKLEKELSAQEKYADEIIRAHRDRTTAESSRLIAAKTAEILRRAVRENLTDEAKSALADASIKAIAGLKQG